MKKTIAMKWAKALESGKYKQTVGALRNEEGYCCLGVLCDLYGEKVGIRPISGTEGFHSADGGTIYCGLLPPALVNLTGMKNNEGSVKKFGRKKRDTSLVALNDSSKNGLTFKQIAQVIRRRYKEL